MPSRRSLIVWRGLKVLNALNHTQSCFTRFKDYKALKERRGEPCHGFRSREKEHDTRFIENERVFKKHLSPQENNIKTAKRGGGLLSVLCILWLILEPGSFVVSVPLLVLLNLAMMWAFSQKANWLNAEFPTTPEDKLDAFDGKHYVGNAKDDGRILALTINQLLTHQLVLGTTGSGKSECNPVSWSVCPE